MAFDALEKRNFVCFWIWYDVVALFVLMRDRRFGGGIAVFRELHDASLDKAGAVCSRVHVPRLEWETRPDRSTFHLESESAH